MNSTFWLQPVSSIILVLVAFSVPFDLAGRICALLNLAGGVYVCWVPNHGPLWKLRDKWRVWRILKKVAASGGQILVSNYDETAGVQAVSTKKAFEEALERWHGETAKLEGEALVKRRTSKIRVYAFPTYTFAWDLSCRVPAHTGVENEGTLAMDGVVTQVLGYRAPLLSPESQKRVIEALCGKDEERRLLIPFLGKGEHGLTLKEQLSNFGDLRPGDLAKSLT